MSRSSRLAALAGLSIAALAAAAPAQAQTYGADSRYAQAPSSQSYQDCIRQQRNRQVAGAVIGGLLGAVVGAELHDESQDRAREDRRYRGDRHYRGRDRYGRHHRRGYRDTHAEGNDGAVVAGGAIGAVAGAAIAGRGECDRYAQTGYGYGSAPGHYGYDQGYGQPRGGAEPIYDESGRPYRDDAYAYEGGYGDQDPYAYDQRSSGELLGGEDYRRDSRVYTAQSAPEAYRVAADGPCREMRSGNGARVLMCQGADGIWRPA